MIIQCYVGEKIKLYGSFTPDFNDLASVDTVSAVISHNNGATSNSTNNPTVTAGAWSFYWTPTKPGNYTLKVYGKVGSTTVKPVVGAIKVLAV